VSLVSPPARCAPAPWSMRALIFECARMIL
jgi:hypothetical protein